MKILITGITGTLGTAVAKILSEEPYYLMGYSRDELKQSKFEISLPLYLGDVRDSKRLIEASRGADLIFHFAALKHVDKLEENPEESISTNLQGTMNVLHAQRVNGVNRVVFSSTDKAAYPINVYGMSKAIAERLVLRNPNNVVCRYGNVLASRGSVVEKFVKTLREKNCVYITDEHMSRFWITIEDAAHFVVANGLSQHNGGLKIPAMKGAVITQISGAIAALLGINSYKTCKIPTRPGEKLIECLRTEYEGDALYSNKVPQYEFNELIEILRPIVKELS